jgi:hypothetical protein
MGYPALPYYSLPGLSSTAVNLYESISVEIDLETIDVSVDVTDTIDVSVEVI